jgi:hypothetical protein
LHFDTRFGRYDFCKIYIFSAKTKGKGLAQVELDQTCGDLGRNFAYADGLACWAVLDGSGPRPIIARI